MQINSSMFLCFNGLSLIYQTPLQLCGQSKDKMMVSMFQTKKVFLTNNNIFKHIYMKNRFLINKRKGNYFELGGPGQMVYNQYGSYFQNDPTNVMNNYNNIFNTLNNTD